MVRKWIRNCLYAGFILVFGYVMYNSFSKLLAQNTAFTQVQKTARAMLYPSVTMCAADNADMFQAHVNDTLGLTMKDLLFAFFHTYEEGNRCVIVVLMRLLPY